MIINNWFHEKNGVALGMTFMGSGIGGMLFNFVAGGCIDAFGWRAAYRILAVIIFLLVVPCVFWVIHVRPEDIGLVPYGEKNQETADAANLTGLSLHEAFHRPYFWIHYLSDIGAPSAICTAAIACSMGALALGKFVVGKMLDRFSAVTMVSFTYLAVCMGLSALMFADRSLLFLFPIVFGMGFGCSFGTLGGSYITRTFFGQRDYVAIMGIFSALGYFGGMLSPIVDGAVFDALGSYVPALAIQLFLTVFVLVLCLATAVRKKQVVTAKEPETGPIPIPADTRR